MSDHNDHSNEISLLDLLLVIAEFWWIIVGGSLLVGAAAYFVATSQPAIYSSSAVLVAPPAQIESMLADLGIQESFEVRASGNNTAIAFKSSSSERAEAALTEFVETAAAQLEATALEPIHARMEALATRRDEIEALTDRAEAALTRWQGQHEPDETAIAIVFQLLQQLQTERFEVREEMRLQTAQIASLPQTIVAVPLGPAQSGSGSSPLLFVVSATMSTGFVLILFAFLRQGLRQSAGKPENKAKLQRIRNALVFRRPTAN